MQRYILIIENDTKYPTVYTINLKSIIELKRQEILLYL